MGKNKGQDDYFCPIQSLACFEAFTSEENTKNSLYHVKSTTDSFTIFSGQCVAPLRDTQSSVWRLLTLSGTYGELSLSSEWSSSSSGNAGLSVRERHEAGVQGFFSMFVRTNMKSGEYRCLNNVN